MKHIWIVYSTWMQGKKENKDTTSATQATHKLHLLFEFVDYGFYSVKSSLVLSFSNALVKQKTGKWICLICVLLLFFFFLLSFFGFVFLSFGVCVHVCVVIVVVGIWKGLDATFVVPGQWVVQVKNLDLLLYLVFINIYQKSWTKC